jgi:hypothetical protein
MHASFVSMASLAAFLVALASLPSLPLFTAISVVHHDTAFAYNRAPCAMAAPALSICPRFCTPSHACTRRYVLLLTSGRSVRRWVSVAASIAFASTRGVSWRGRGRQPIRQAATSTAISASVFQRDRAKPTSTVSPTSTSRAGFGTNFSLSESNA